MNASDMLMLERRDAEGRAAAIEQESDAVADIAAFTDWLGGECFDAKPVHLGFVPRDPLAIDFASMPTARVVAYLLDTNTNIAGWAAWELRGRYLKHRTGAGNG